MSANRGKLALDAPLRTYLPELRLADADATAQVTMRHLLTHTGGWEVDYFLAANSIGLRSAPILRRLLCLRST